MSYTTSKGDCSSDGQLDAVLQSDPVTGSVYFHEIAHRERLLIPLLLLSRVLCNPCVGVYF